jgi:hypothetical protein
MTAVPRATEACLKLLDALIEGVGNLDSIGAVDRVQLHTTAQVEAWLREEREIAATAVLDGLPAHEHPAWTAGVRWAAREAAVQTEGRDSWTVDVLDHLSLCAQDPQRGAVPRTDTSVWWDGWDGIGCPTCHTILNAKTAKCHDLWHADNNPPTPKE